ncbi:MAG: BTAD domain-containing putative transcriptional regulator [Caldilineaceae bacterium]
MTLPALSLYLFGPLRIEQNGAPVALRRRKAQALLAYLAVTGQPHSRDALATLLWPEFNQSQARTNLRRELAELRGLLGKGRLLDDRVTVALNMAPPFTFDLRDFQDNLAQARQCLHPGHPATTDACPACLPHLNEAAARYRDDFLAGFALPDSPAFDDWQFFQADGLRQTLTQLLERLVQGHSTVQQYAEAIPHARRWVALDPLHEPAHCALMVAYELAGQRAAALRQYESCVRVLDEELGAPPSAETTALVEQIQQRAGETGQPIQLPSWPGPKAAEHPAETPSPAAPPPFQAPAPPPHFVGRDAEITQLCTGLLQPETPIYALVGMGGAGKTTLAAQVAQLLRDDFPDGVLWAHAVSSDPLDIAATWARAYGYDFGGLSDLESRAAAIRGVLAEKVVLIVLDNVEQSSEIRPLLPNGDHCAVLLTTRDLDAANALNAQVLFLGELSAANSRQLLVAILGAPRVVDEEEAVGEIGALLHYLPLAVEIVAQRLKSRPRQRLSQIVERLQDEAGRLALEISDRAVRASFAVSWAALDEPLQRCFALLGVFAGRPFAAEAIAYLAEAQVDVTEEWLFALEALSLVKAEGERYYRQHPLLADFAREKLVDGAEVSTRMADYYYEFAQVNQQHYAVLKLEWEKLMVAELIFCTNRRTPLVNTFVPVIV